MVESSIVHGNPSFNRSALGLAHSSLALFFMGISSKELAFSHLRHIRATLACVEPVARPINVDARESLEAGSLNLKPQALPIKP